MQDDRYRSRFPSVFRDSTDLADNWKGSDWFGNYYYNKDTYPWIYHTDFGWSYINSTSDTNAWVYLPSIGWIWLSKDTTEQFNDGATYNSYHQDGKYLRFEFEDDPNKTDRYYDYTVKRWIAYKG